MRDDPWTTCPRARAILTWCGFVLLLHLPAAVLASMSPPYSPRMDWMRVAVALALGPWYGPLALVLILLGAAGVPEPIIGEKWMGVAALLVLYWMVLTLGVLWRIRAGASMGWRPYLAGYSLGGVMLLMACWVASQLH